MTSAFFKFLLPKNDVFFNLFNQSSVNNVQMSELLYKAVSDESAHKSSIHFNQINHLKLKGNELKHQVYHVSSKALISPFERNDMYALASAINDVCDSIHIAARRINLYKLEYVSPAAKDIAGIVIEASMALNNCVQALNDLKNTDSMTQCCNSIKQLERYADRVYNQALSAIVAQETNSIELIKYTEILAALEKATDKCEDATAVIESIIVKNK
ncbi:DUF47 domain-containing protein [Mucilaginibacter lacusdianchii]|uniref:DUF47 domain-containing protein n=1 Tax=Mucilaginibacter lacusdianchii TaxID=2684211 RepID=UPI00131B2BB0|nr:DUF47 family protein [Mucilaginibacter sp. JXJ CY 39]